MKTRRPASWPPAANWSRVLTRIQAGFFLGGRALRAARRELALYEPPTAKTGENGVRVLELSSPERFALALALALLLLQALPAGDALEFRRSALAAEPWRALTAHLVHVSWPHALINGAALWIVARLLAQDLDAWRQAIALTMSAFAVSVLLAWLHPGIEWYRGLSGALHGLFFAGTAKWLACEHPRTVRRLWLPAVLFVGGWIKVVVEQPAGSAIAHAEWLGAPVVPQAHLAGALAGSVLGLLFAATQPRGDKQQRGQ